MKIHYKSDILCGGKMKVEEIRNLLLDYFGTAMQENPCAVICLSEIEQMTDDEIVQCAIKNGLIH